MLRPLKFTVSKLALRRRPRQSRNANKAVRSDAEGGLGHE